MLSTFFWTKRQVAAKTPALMHSGYTKIPLKSMFGATPEGRALCNDPVGHAGSLNHHMRALITLRRYQAFFWELLLLDHLIVLLTFFLFWFGFVPFSG